MERADAIFPLLSRSKSSAAPRRVWTLAASAALVLALLMWPRPDANLRAETLLPRIEASFSRDQSRARLGLRVRTSGATFVRPALLGVADPSDLHWRDRFRAANYDWNDPLNPRAFSEWRNRLKHKSDRVLVSPPSAGAGKRITIETTAQENALKSASLTVDAATLLPLSARFIFGGDGWMEITATPGFPPETGVAASPEPVLPKSAGSEVAPLAPNVDRRAATELAVWLIADRLSDPAAEPVRLEIGGEKQLSVTPYSLNFRQFQQLSASLQNLPGVDLRVPGSQSFPQALPERDPLVNLTETIFSRAHLLADLAAHFPEAVEFKLTGTDRIELWQLRLRHAEQLKREIESLAARVKSDGAASTGDPASEPAVGLSLIEKLAHQAGKVNRSVTALSAERTANPEASLPDEIAKLRDLAESYAGAVAQGLEKVR
jgi:hypothetical protein